MDYRYLFEYARRNALLNFDPYMGKALQIADFGPEATDAGRVDGKLFGVNLGMNSMVTLINRTVLEQLGLKAPTIETTWAQFADLGAEITKKANKPGFYGLADASGYEPEFEAFNRQRGKALYTADGKLAFGVEDANAWFEMWAKMRETKACVPPDVQAIYKNSIDTSTVTLGKSAIDFAHSNQLVGFQALNKEKVGITPLPNAGPGRQARPVPEALHALERVLDREEPGRGGEDRQLLRRQPRGRQRDRPGARRSRLREDPRGPAAQPRLAGQRDGRLHLADDRQGRCAAAAAPEGRR